MTLFPKRIPVVGPSITKREIALVSEAVATAWYENAGSFNARFEAAFAAHIGVAHAISLPSCTSALHLSLAALGVGPGDEVIVPDATWIASAAPISYVGATPVFADIDPLTWCIDPASVEKLITPRTKAVVAVDLYGGMPDMDRLGTVLARRGIPLVEDAAEAIGAAYRGRPAGSFGRTGTFSFHGSKTLTTGEGGMLVTDSEEVAARVNVLRDHGRAPGDVRYFNGEVAFKYKMTSLQAALGLAQLERIDELVAAKRRIFGWYRDRLAGIPGLALNAEPAGTTNGYWLVTVVLDPALGIAKERLGAALGARGIDTRPFFHPLSSLPAYADARDRARAQAANRNAYRICAHGVNLPSGVTLGEAEVDYVAAQLRDLVRAEAA